MKKLVFLFVFAISFISCEKEVDFIKFSGKITHKGSDKISLIKDGKKVKSFIVDENGVFSDTIQHIEKGYYSFSDGKESSGLYLENGFDIHLSLDTKEFDETISYTGTGSEANNYLAAKYLLKEKNPPTKLYVLEEAAFLSATDTSYTDINNMLHAIKNTSFVAFETKNLAFEKASAINMYGGYHGFLTKKRSFKVSDTFPNAFEGIVMDNDEDFKNFPSYQNIVIGNSFKNAREIAKKDSIPFQTAALNLIKPLSGKNIQQGLLKQLAYSVSARNPEAEALYKGIMEISTDADFKKSLTKKYNTLKALVVGKASPKFVDYENYKGGTTSLDDLKGKFVYVDVWATWCAPCKKEIPFLKKIEKQYHDKNIYFVSISIDKKKDHQAWLDMVKDKKLSGVQLFADADWNSKFVKDYGINGIPRFLLIDPQGNIISTDAPRPSNPALIALFTKNGI